MASTIEFLEYHVGFALEEHDETHAYLRVGTEHHSLELVHDPSLMAFRYDGVGFRVDDEAVLSDLEERVRAAGHEVLPLTEGLKGLCRQEFAVVDANARRVGSGAGFLEYAETPWPALRPHRFVHPFVVPDRSEEPLNFYMNVPGFLA